MSSGLGELSRAIEFVTAHDEPFPTGRTLEDLQSLRLGSLSPILRYINSSTQRHDTIESRPVASLPPVGKTTTPKTLTTLRTVVEPHRLIDSPSLSLAKPKDSGLSKNDHHAAGRGRVSVNTVSKSLPVTPPKEKGNSISNRALQSSERPIAPPTPVNATSTAHKLTLRPASLPPTPLPNSPSQIHSAAAISASKERNTSAARRTGPDVPQFSGKHMAAEPLQSGGKKVHTSQGLRESRVIQPKSPRAVKDRNFALYLRVKEDFAEDEDYLTSLMPRAIHNNDPRGIHVFVDASNIFIGFMKEMKISRGIPEHVHVTGANLHFDALALLMERRRPVAKRVLVGSNPHLPAFDQAEAIGYECSILDKVEKARQLTDRQVFFMNRDEQRRQEKAFADRRAYTPSRQYAAAYGQKLEPKTDGKSMLFAPIAKVEQGVDELIHLKMSESIIDHDEPGTMVVATGDANKAEYSDGFLATIERALRKGWKVELVAWNRSISAMYKKPSWARKWAGQFRIILLDEYAEDLLDFAKH